jgi:Domain of unknown function (DUF4209)
MPFGAPKSNNELVHFCLAMTDTPTNHLPPPAFDSEQLKALNLDGAFELGDPVLRGPNLDFRQRMMAAHEASEHDLAKLYATLDAVCWPLISPQDSVSPFTNLPQRAPQLFRDGLMTDEAVAQLRAAFGAVTQPWLRARFGDALWTFARDHTTARTAVNAYLEYSRDVDDVELWVEPVSALVRALRLAQSLGRRELLITIVLEDMERRVLAADGNDPYFYTHELIQCLLEARHGDPTRWAALLEKIARREVASGHQAERHWTLVIAAHRAARNTADADAAVAACGEMWAQLAAQALLQPDLQRFLIADYLERAIGWLRSTRQHRERVKTLRKQLIDVQDEALDQMGLFEETLSSDDPRVRASLDKYIDHVRHEKLFDAVVALAALARPPSYQRTEAAVLDARGRYPLLSFFPTKPIGARGQNVVGASSSAEDQFLIEFFAHRDLERQGNVFFLEAARSEVLKHPLHPLELLELVCDNPLVARGHENLVLRGLVAGLGGDFVTATHLLVPQIEAGLRHLLQLHGMVTSGLSSVGVQDEASLNTLLEDEEYAQPLEGILGKETVYELRGLLVDRAGANVRNDMAHGLLPEWHFYSYQVLGVFYIALYLFTCGAVARRSTDLESAEAI